MEPVGKRWAVGWGSRSDTTAGLPACRTLFGVDSWVIAK
jgi:hypothetical protein